MKDCTTGRRPAEIKSRLQSLTGELLLLSAGLALIVTTLVFLSTVPMNLLLSFLGGSGTLLIVTGLATFFRRLGQIQESEQKYHRLIDTAGDAILICDWTTGRVLESNHKAVEMLGAQGPSEECWKEFVASLSGSNGLNHEMRLCGAGGRSIPVEVSANLVDIGHRTVVQSIVHDLTERKETEEALRVARDKAIDESRVKGQFLANMSHEIRTPMNGVLGMITVLQTTELTDEQREFVGIAKDSAESLLTIINDILDFSRIEAGRLEIHESPFDLREMAGHVMDMLRVRAEQKGLKLISRCDHRLPERLNGDADRLRQIVTNLLTNAVKFTERGGVTLDIVHKTAADSSEWVRFQIRDTGIGISADVQRKLFAPFSQADGSITHKYGGSGLGLAISKQLVSLMGGEIGVSSEAGLGSTFWFEVPLKP